MYKLFFDYKNLFVGEFSEPVKNIKILYQDNPNFIVDGEVISPYAVDTETDLPVLVSKSNRIKHLNYYVNRFGFPKKGVPSPEKEKQDLVISKVKMLKRRV